MANLTATAIARGLGSSGSPLHRRARTVREAVRKAARPNSPFASTQYERHGEGGQRTPTRTSDPSDPGPTWTVDADTLAAFLERYVRMQEAFWKTKGRYPVLGEDREFTAAAWKLIVSVLGQPSHRPSPPEDA
jgi:hypothetical protein